MACVASRRGVFVLDYRDQRGIRRWKTTRWEATPDNRLAAEKELAKVCARIADGTYVDKTEQKTFAQLADAYVSALTVRALTRHDYVAIIDRWYRPHFGRMKLLAITAQDVEAYRASITGRMASATVNKHLTYLAMMFSYAERHRWMPNNPAASRLVKRLKLSREARRAQLDGNILTPAEVQRLIDHAASPRDRCLFRLAVESGLRQGELLALRWTDIDWASSRLFVRRSYRRGVTSDPKTDSSGRAVGLTPQMVAALRVWKLACPQPPGGLGLVFPNRLGRYEVRANLMARGFEPALRRAGLRHIRFHDLRHTCASWLVASGVPIRDVSAHLGHASTKQTLDTYCHLLPGAASAAASTMARLLGGVASGSKDEAAEPDTRLVGGLRAVENGVLSGSKA
jgi:integrase